MVAGFIVMILVLILIPFTRIKVITKAAFIFCFSVFETLLVIEIYILNFPVADDNIFVFCVFQGYLAQADNGFDGSLHVVKPTRQKKMFNILRESDHVIKTCAVIIQSSCNVDFFVCFSFGFAPAVDYVAVAYRA